ncbi:E3 ubiquitin-protein ligase SIRP1-like [Rhodamnia argentea]|uniref:RING-type E3 ubiquitin transferase n=1 Tax=Rhodamnia argentea TaxID=178133 RepID=A0A8B8QKH5_9MYRT|nr:E3 ubiquitin-protein ligase SIRP1-like [Rhodamnia argentea]XP_030547652.1 E3 ubiquitin-protein ligase SIRP1-like [Rhodamnia argentea]XP_048137487.1 E3 ubiquitin-protein ligase SIRP1-like [Rhodamnia argentea]XP_048137488.1 E3 ubiquitin-protein ligase SIRP1-like [Rhodamnia argentea]
MEEPVATRYWCHMCSQTVDPIMEVEIKCPICDSGFIEEMGAGTGDSQGHDLDLGSDRALSLWAPILLGMMGHPHRRRISRRLEFDDEDDDNEDGESRHEGETELDREIESIIRRRRRSSATILQLLQGIRAGIAAESDDANRNRDVDREDGERDRDRDRDRDREQERVIFINPFNQTIIVQGSSYDSTRNENTVGSLGDYFIGPGLDLLLQHLAENDPNRYGTPPAQKEAVESMPTVTIKENLQCSVCLDDFEIGAEAKEMPCKHKFHCGCILPWLELHSSCPVCRYQLPADESKLDSDGSRNVNNRRQRERESENGHESGEDGNDDERSGNSRRFSLPWPFSGLFSSSGSQSGGGNSPSSSSATQANGHESSSQMDEN